MEALSGEIIMALVFVLGLGSSAIHYKAYASEMKKQRVYLRKKK